MKRQMGKNTPSLLTLAISHNLYLPPASRHQLAAGTSVSAVGVSVPVWFAKGRTNEPASEVFCNYLVHNFSTLEEAIYIKPNGYEFNLPQLPRGFCMPPEISDEEWSVLGTEEREALLEERQVPIHGRNLLDPCQGGSGSLAFTRVALGGFQGIAATIIHSVRIADVAELEDTLVR